MNGSDFNTLASAALSALLLIFGGMTLIHETVGHHGEVAGGYKLPVEVASADTSTSSGGGEAEAPTDIWETIKPMLASASVESGQKFFRACAACHSVNEGGKNLAGPNLWSVVNRDIASIDAYAYSNVLKEKEGGWSFEALTRFLHKPKEWAKGTKMGYNGVRKESDLANVVAYLNSLSSSPAELPTAE
ncbi:MAG: cytochrome c family protein [Pseudomonadota bacterium]